MAVSKDLASVLRATANHAYCRLYIAGTASTACAASFACTACTHTTSTASTSDSTAYILVV